MERYDKIEYNFEEASEIPQNDSITTTDREGFITSQQYAVTNEVSSNDEISEDFVETEQTQKRDRNAPRENVLVFQLTVCILLAIAAFVIKSIGGELYENVKSLYYDNINNSIIIDVDNNNNYDFVSEFIGDSNK